jgi:hypothetical protein
MFHQTKRLVVGAVAVAALALGASAISSAASSSSSTDGATTTNSSPRAVPPPFNGPAPGTASHEDAEKTVTGAAATRTRAAAVRAVGTGTAGKVTTDYRGDGYEVIVTKSGGGQVEVHLDGSFQLMQPPGGHGGPPPGGHGAPPSSSGA